MSDHSPDLRASDDERERAAGVLRRATSEGRLDVDELEERLGRVYAARTGAELQQLVADVSSEALSGAEPPAAAAVAVREGPGGDAWIVSIMGGSERRGFWRIAPRCTVVNVMGGSDIDLCDVELSAATTDLNVYSLMGGGDVRVPDGVRVEVSRFALMGGHDIRLGDAPLPADAPVIRLRLVSIMGGCDVRRGRRRRRRRDRGLGAARRRGELDS